ncbi:hypothetical protein [Aureispira sp. CCB-QB1]|uniref:hypothetical protein n=1 Tax=Aureispira sp. CCB-QB1 TaxID=1313421 RepID=UPI0006965323|nr:hypothetical protein [Aureispira sp. CCB-QB1]
MKKITYFLLPLIIFISCGDGEKKLQTGPINAGTGNQLNQNISGGTVTTAGGNMTTEHHYHNSNHIHTTENNSKNQDNPIRLEERDTLELIFDGYNKYTKFMIDNLPAQLISQSPILISIPRKNTNQVLKAFSNSSEKKTSGNFQNNQTITFSKY